MTPTNDHEHRWCAQLAEVITKHAVTSCTVAELMITTDLGRGAVERALELLPALGWTITRDGHKWAFTPPENPSIRIDANRCRHLNPMIHPASRAVSCRDCGDLVDPFDVLHRIAQDISSIAAERDRFRRQAADAKANLAKVKKQVAKARRDLAEVGRQAAIPITEPAVPPPDSVKQWVAGMTREPFVPSSSQETM